MNPNFNLRLKGKVAIVTGAASGIGKAATMFAEQGVKVGIIDIDHDRGIKTESLICSRGGTATFLCRDITNPEQVAAAVKLFYTGFGPIDILVNNAGIEYNDRGNIITMPYDDMMRILQVNLLGAVHCVRSVVPRMRSQGGSIVNVSSIQGLGAHLPGTMYQATKSALIGLTHGLAIELGPRGIRVNAIAPGAVATEGMGAVRSNQPGIMDAYRKRIPVRRRANADEMARSIGFLCSELASYVNGAVLVADGGYSINLTPDSLIENPEHVDNDPDL